MQRPLEYRVGLAEEQFNPWEKINIHTQI